MNWKLAASVIAAGTIAASAALASDIRVDGLKNPDEIYLKPDGRTKAVVDPNLFRPSLADRMRNRTWIRFQLGNQRVWARLNDVEWTMIDSPEPGHSGGGLGVED